MKDGKTTAHMCARYGVSKSMLSSWRRAEGFPEKGSERVGKEVVWNEAATDRYLKARPLPMRGPIPRWLSVVGKKVPAKKLVATPSRQKGETLSTATAAS